MRVLLSKESKLKLLNFLKREYNCLSLNELSQKINIPKNTLDMWFYNSNRYIPEIFIPKNIKNQLSILDKQEDNWGRTKGGKKTYKIIVEKYGKEEIRKRQSNGGKKAMLKRYDEKPFILNISDQLFLELYGVLLGDGWIGKYKWKNKIIWLIGISGHAKLDREFLLYCKQNIEKICNRNAYLKEKPKFNAIEINFTHKTFLKALNEELGFPIGKKVDIKISDKILSLGSDKLKYVIRGIFDTDGCFYLDKTPAGHPYPCISIQMKASILIKQLYDILISVGFKPIYKKGEYERKILDRITLKGSKQLRKWMEEIGSSNPKHLNKINKINKISALVAQLDSAKGS